MAPRIAVGILFLGTLCVGSAYGSAFAPGTGRVGAWGMIVGTALMILGTLLLGAGRPGRPLGGLVLVFAFLFLLVGGCLAAALLLPAENVGSALLLGLPRRAAIVLYGLGVVPFLVLPVAYARTFDRLGLGEAELAAFRERAASLRGAASRAASACGDVETR
ncbi:MAG: hypothetical protein ACYC1S_04775 [Gemmatimonadaceae bacterium]